MNCPHIKRELRITKEPFKNEYYKLTFCKECKSLILKESLTCNQYRMLSRFGIKYYSFYVNDE